MERGFVEAVGALMRDDPVAARAAVKRLQAACRRLAPEEDDTFGRGFGNLDQALHKVLGGTLEYLAAGDPEEAFNEFVWVQRSCRQCHALARERGFLPAAGPLWQVDGPEAKRVETTHTVGEKP
jgi:hypothetical protein